MSNAYLNLCWPLRMPPVAKFVLIAMADHADAVGYCFPSIEELSARTCFSRDAVMKGIKWLEANGYVSADRSNGRHSKYWVTLDRSSSTTGSPERPVVQNDRTSRPERPHQSPRAAAPVAQNDTNHQEPSVTIKEPPTRAARLPLPDWLDPNVWAMWKRFKGECGSWSQHIEIRSLNELSRIRGKGHDPQEVVERSIASGWANLYPLPPDSTDGELCASWPYAPKRRSSALNGFRFKGT